MCQNRLPWQGIKTQTGKEKQMREISIGERQAGQRLDKFLHRLLPAAPSSFFYKMLRKKNITLNGQKAQGGEKLQAGDVVCLYLSEETIGGFSGNQKQACEYEEAYHALKGVQVVYEDAHVIVMNKPAGVLSQKAAREDLSLNEWMIGYLLATDPGAQACLDTCKPSVCNRLDRNTAGLVMGARTLAGSQKISALLRSRSIRKFYRLFVKGQVEDEVLLEGYLVKDEENNTVRLVEKGESEQAVYIKTRYYPIRRFSDRTLVEAELITGKTHQIRIHLAAEGHPLIGDYKYGDRAFNEKYKKRYRISSQLLYACRLEFPQMEAPFDGLNRRVISIPAPSDFRKLEEETQESGGKKQPYLKQRTARCADCSCYNKPARKA